MSHKSFDVVIIGSGMAGALLAHRLAQAKVNTLILEAGDFVPDMPGRYDLVRTFAKSAAKGQDAPYVEFKTADGQLLTAPQPEDENPNKYYVQDKNAPQFKSFYERIVGGSMWHWQGICIRMIPSDFKMKTMFGKGFDWPVVYDDLERYYSEAESEMGVAGPNTPEGKQVYEEILKAHRSKPFPMDAIATSYLDRTFVEKLKGTHIVFGGKPYPIHVTPVPQARNSRVFDGRPACDGRLSCVPLCPTRAKYEAIFHLEKALGAGATLRQKSVVTKLISDADGKITAVKYVDWNKNEHTVRGKVVVLAAGGIENPRLLLDSGVANSSGKLGMYLMDHPIKQSWALAPWPVYPYRGPQTTSDITSLRDGNFRRDAGAFKTSIKNDGWAGPTGAPVGRNYDVGSGTMLDFVHNQGRFGKDLRQQLKRTLQRQITLNSAVEMLPIETSTVSLAKDVDVLGIRRPKIDFKVDDDTLYTRKAFRNVIQLHDFVFKQLGATAVNLNDTDLKDDTTLLVYQGSGHIMGTTIMGFDKKASVVDRDGRTWDHNNLFILGSSVFPTSSTANPTLTIAALALRMVDTIKERLKHT